MRISSLFKFALMAHSIGQILCQGWKNSSHDGQILVQDKKSISSSTSNNMHKLQVFKLRRLVKRATSNKGVKTRSNAATQMLNLDCSKMDQVVNSFWFIMIANLLFFGSILSSGVLLFQYFTNNQMAIAKKTIQVCTQHELQNRSRLQANNCLHH